MIKGSCKKSASASQASGKPDSSVPYIFAIKK
jgi:hypothetical protein